MLLWSVELLSSVACRNARQRESRRQSLLIQWLQPRRGGNGGEGKQRRGRKAFAFAFPAVAVAFLPLATISAARANKNLEPPRARHLSSLSSCLLPRHPGSLTPSHRGWLDGGRTVAGPACRRRRDPRMYVWPSSWIASWYRFLCRLLPACRLISGLRFGYLLLLTWLRNVDSFFFFVVVPICLHVGGVQLSHSTDDLAFLDGSPACLLSRAFFFKMNFSEVLPA